MGLFQLTIEYHQMLRSSRTNAKCQFNNKSIDNFC